MQDERPPKRALKVAVDGEGHGTGFPVGRTLVLTAMHVVRRDWTEADATGDVVIATVGGRVAQLVWPEPADVATHPVDAALLEMRGAEFESWYELDVGWPDGASFESEGYPGSVSESTAIPVAGTLHRDEGKRSTGLSCTGPTPNTSADWQGLSGAPVVVQGRVVGLVVNRQDRWNGLLRAVPVRAIAACAGFRAHIPVPECSALARGERRHVRRWAVTAMLLIVATIAVIESTREGVASPDGGDPTGDSLSVPDGTTGLSISQPNSMVEPHTAGALPTEVTEGHGQDDRMTHPADITSPSADWVRTPAPEVVDLGDGSLRAGTLILRKSAALVRGSRIGPELKALDEHLAPGEPRWRAPTYGELELLAALIDAGAIQHAIGDQIWSSEATRTSTVALRYEGPEQPATKRQLPNDREVYLRAVRDVPAN